MSIEWTPSRIIAWAEKTGHHTATLVEAIMAAKPFEIVNSDENFERWGKDTNKDFTFLFAADHEFLLVIMLLQKGLAALLLLSFS